MTALKQEILTLIEAIPDEKSDVLIEILNSVREILGVDSKSRAERNIAIMDEIHNLIGNDIPWASEDDMIRELADMRRITWRIRHARALSLKRTR